ncbi:MAG: VWA domain-containing protein [Bryobacteraceae bacterium]
MGILPSYPSRVASFVFLVSAMFPLVGAKPDKRFARADFGQSQTAEQVREAGSTLQPGASQTFRLPSAATPTFYTGDYAFLITVPTGATKLEINISGTTPGVDLDIYVRRGSDPTLVNGQVDAEFRAEGETGDETIIIDSQGWTSSSEPRRSTPTLQAGVYHVAFGVRTVNTAVTSTITAIVTGGSAPPPVTPPPSVDLTGTWNWTASCTGGSFTGQFQIQQSGATITGSFLGSDPGTINGTVEANRFTFTRAWSAGSQTWSGTAGSSISGQLAMQGTATGTNPPTQCTFSATLGSGGSSGGGGGGGTTAGALTVVITQEDNSECPARKKLVASVTDSAGQPVVGLGQSNFDITENGQPVAVQSVICTTAGGATSAGSVAIVIDRSGSLSSADLTAEKTAAKQLVDQLPSSDAVAVYSFGSSVTVQQTFTTDKTAAKAAIDAISGGGNTLLYQAIIDASNALSTRPGRRAVVVMTDGQNSGTNPSDQAAIDAAKAAQTPVFTVGFGSGINQTVLQKIATDTGGVFLSGANSAALTQLLGRIGQVLTSQCVITYVPSNAGASPPVTLTAHDSAGGTTRTGSTTRTVSACTAPGGGSSTGTCPGNITALTMEGGSFANGAFGGNGQVWDTVNNGFWILGVSQPSGGSPLLNPGATINLAPGSYFLYSHTTNSGTHVRITVGWSNGTTESAVFSVGNAAAASSWTRVSGSASISLGSTGLTIDLVGAGDTASSPNGVPDTVLRLDINCAASGGGSGTGGGTGTGGGSTTQPGCDYFVRPLEYSFGQPGGTAGGSAPPNTTFNPPVLVTTRPECKWGSISNDAWITLEAGQSGQGDGAVSYRVAANGTANARTGTVTIAGRTHTVRQAAGSACSYSISPASATVSSSGGFGSIDVTASPSDCTWTAAAQAEWIGLNSGQRTAGGIGNGSVNFSAGSNPSASTRTGTILVAGRTFTVTQNAAGTTGTPAVPPNGVVPAGSGTPPSLPGGAIAQGSFFTVFAFDVGPANPEQATAYPLPMNLGGTEVLLRQGSLEVNAYLVFTSRSQVNGIIPSNTPLGDVDMIVVYNGRRSNPVRIRVVRNNFNIFTTRAGSGPGIITNFVTQTNQPLNTRSTTAGPGQVVTIWGNGGGPITAPDNVAPPVGNLPFDFEVHVGGKPQKLLYYGRSSCCSALDQVVIELSADVPLGCAVPVQVRAGGSGAPWSNVATMAISTGGAACTDAGNPVSSLPQSGGKIGAVLLVKGNALIPLKANATPENISADLGLGVFLNVPAGGALGFSSFASFPPVGSCQAIAGNQDVSSLLGGSLPGLSQGVGGTQLDAGVELTVTAPSGRAVKLARTDDTSSTGPYAGLLGGSIPFPGVTPGALFLEPGTFRVTGLGGKDVGAFNATATFPQLVTWTNRDQITTMSRSQGVLIEWAGGGPDDRVLVIGGATDQKTKAGAAFICVAAGSDRRLQVPPSAMSNLPATRGAALEDSFGLLGVSSLSLGSITPFTAPGLDIGLVVPGTLDLRTLSVQ